MGFVQVIAAHPLLFRNNGQDPGRKESLPEQLPRRVFVSPLQAVVEKGDAIANLQILLMGTPHPFKLIFQLLNDRPGQIQEISEPLSIMDVQTRGNFSFFRISSNETRMSGGMGSMAVKAKVVGIF
jgi:hypothetical protein